MCCTDLWSLWLLAKLGHPHPVPQCLAGAPKHCTLLPSPVTPAFKMLHYSLAEGGLMPIFIIF